ncbi:hypothetical protein EXU85_04635 [Spirosoma sp. KCTC 42546]|uniref:hypothetical protein n=1 Tax=Spirosoma sp. KCTC 42546 TaxID=2520506 RepID=UPI0011595B2C|nr:hypothetical protein [Spirosoma sp. KCTC 42546]QDK77912.1 hypothetical protein EXU85_04635 [Spirosoma sp. KCTC 42546]
MFSIYEEIGCPIADTFSYGCGQGGREEGRKGGREEGRKGGREEGRKGGREEGRKGGREERNKKTMPSLFYLSSSPPFLPLLPFLLSFPFIPNEVI